MIIQKKRIFNISPYILHIAEGSKIIVGIPNLPKFSSSLVRIGFSEPYESGQSILPASIGPVSRYNAEGKEIIHKDQQMETAYRQVDWKWKEWDGTWHSKIVDVPYQRYPRTFIEPPSVELSIVKSSDGELILTSPLFEKNEKDMELLTHTVNLLLELFGECQFFTKALETIIKTPLRRLNWTVLPQGEMPWEQFKKEIDPIVKNAPEGNRKVLYYRLEVVNSLKPDFRAIGTGGFHGYIVHGFTKKKIYVLESMYYGNATYIFDEDWEELSQMTKAQILNESLQKARVVHRESWEEKFKEIIVREGQRT